MSQIRVNFLNWRPDLDATSHDGLAGASNVLHSEDGYKPIHVQTAAAFATTTAFTGMPSSVLSVQLRPLGTSGRYLVGALIPSAGNTTVSLAVGVTDTDFVSATVLASGFTGTTATSATVNLVGGTVPEAEFVAFSVAELEGSAFVVAKANVTLEAGTETSLNVSGTVSYDVA